jgi:hypothetical protein
MATKRHFGIIAMSIMATLSIVVGGESARASQLAYEGFRLSFPIYADGGTGFIAPWTGLRHTTLAKSLCFSKQKTSEGGSVSGQDGLARRDLALPLGSVGSTRYISFLVQPLSDHPDGLSFFGLALDPLFIGKPGGGAEDEYVIENSGGTNQASSGVQAVVGRTSMLVVKLEFNSGPDVMTLYVDPTPGRPEPAGDAVKTDLDLGLVSRMALASTGASYAIDEIRVGTTYADVVSSGDNQSSGDFQGCL